MVEAHGTGIGPGTVTGWSEGFVDSLCREISEGIEDIEVARRAAIPAARSQTQARLTANAAISAMQSSHWQDC